MAAAISLPGAAGRSAVCRSGAWVLSGVQVEKGGGRVEHVHCAGGGRVERGRDLRRSRLLSGCPPSLWFHPRSFSCSG